MKREELKFEICVPRGVRIVVYRGVFCAGPGLSSLEQATREGESPVFGWDTGTLRNVYHESRCLGPQRKMGGKFHLKLNNGERPIANKYCEGKMKRTLKRELKRA